MTTDWLITGVGLALVALIITATVLVMRYREQARKAAREAESLIVISDDTRRAFWYSGVDHSSHSDSSSHGGGWSDSGGDSGGGSGGGD